MKRIALHFGASCAVALLFANVLGVNAAIYISIAAGVLFVISLLVKNIRQALTLPIVTGAVLLSCLLFIFVWNNSVSPVQALDGQRAYSTFQIVDIPKKTGDGFIYTAKVKTVDKENSAQNFKVKIFSEAEITADYYDDISAYLTFEKTADNAFDSYGDFGESIFIRAYTDFGSGEFVFDNSTSKPLNYYFIKLRERIKRNTAYVTKGDEGPLALALFIGDKSELSANTQSNFKISGVYHVMAVSGLHTSVICLGVYYILKKLRVPLPVTVIATYLTLFSYLAAADFSRSVVRSAITVCVFVTAGLISKRADRLNSLGAAMIILCLNPFAVTDASAVLTVCAVIGITCVKPELDKLIKTKKHTLRFIFESLSLTGAIMITTLPASMLFFDSVSLLGFIANLIIIPFTEITLVSALLFNLFSFSAVTAFLPKYVMIFSSKVMLEVTSFLAEHFSFLYMDISDRMFFIMVSLCLLFCGISILIFKKIDIKPFCVFIACAFVMTTTLTVYSDSKSVYMNVSGYNVVTVCDSDNILIIDLDDGDDYYAVRDIVLHGNYKNAVLFNCDYDRQRTEKLFNCPVQFFNLQEIDIDLCSDIGVKYSNTNLQITIFDESISVSDDYVIFDGCKAFRGVSDKFRDDRNYVFKFSDNKTVQVRREANG
ncbi:MAG: ComEC/Rec2 family competence protein [Eubacteriales bacterium]|nr:ComEC/Rec2 family competence protein [Eubacteriales bacterium]